MSTNLLKILLVGDSKTGKYCYIKMLTDNIFPSGTQRHKEIDVVKIKIKIDDTTEIPIAITSVSGSQYGKSKIKKYFKNIDGFIIMFDVSRAETFDNMMLWKKHIDNVNNPKKLPSMLLLNKCDLERDEDLTDLVVENVRESVGFSICFETSVRENVKVQRSMISFIREIIESKRSSRTIPSVPSPAADDLPREYRFKVIVIGEINTGKTAFIQRYVTNMFSGVYRNTIGTDLAVKKIQYRKNIIVNLHFWDIAGDERFGAMTQLFYKDTAGCLIVFDVSKPYTLANGAVKWKEDFDAKINFDPNHLVPCVLVGNKSDLPKEGISNSEPHMTEFCRQHKFIHWFETSAKDNTNIPQPILFLIEEMIKAADNNPYRRRLSEPIRLNSKPVEVENTGCCQS